MNAGAGALAAGAPKAGAAEEDAGAPKGLLVDVEAPNGLELAAGAPNGLLLLLGVDAPNALLELGAPKPPKDGAEDVAVEVASAAGLPNEKGEGLAAAPAAAGVASLLALL